jgi:hypothetical protein
MAGDVVSERLERLARKLLVGELQLLQADDIGLALSQPVQRELEPGAKSVDVPGGNPHRRSCRRCARSSTGHGPGAFGLLIEPKNMDILQCVAALNREVARIMATVAGALRSVVLDCWSDV